MQKVREENKISGKMHRFTKKGCRPAHDQIQFDNNFEFNSYIPQRKNVLYDMESKTTSLT